MSVDETTGTSEPLTEAGLASVFEGFLSDEPEYQETAETPPTQESPESEPESEEVESSTEPDDTEQGESEETEETEESQIEQPQTYRVKVNGEEVEVTHDELLRGYSRTQDYTRKTQELAEQRRVAGQYAEHMRAGREQLATQLTELEQALKDQQPQEPDWVKEQQENPEQFPAKWAQWSQYKERMQALAQERHRATEAVQRDRSAAYEAQVAEARQKLAEYIPEWKDAGKAKAEKAKMIAAATEDYGYTQDEMRQVIDPRIMRVLRDATLYRELQKKKPQIEANITKVKAATPGASGANRKPKSKARVAEERLAQSGSSDDFAALLIEKGLAG